MGNCGSGRRGPSTYPLSVSKDRAGSTTWSHHRIRSSASFNRRSAHVTKQVRQLDRVVIRFAGDSGDGMQLTGDRFTSETAQLGNDISTLPNFPAEIRAPAGTLPGVSS